MGCMVNKSERKRQLAVSVTLGLLLACGGHHHCLAADYDGGRFTVNNKQVTYDNVTVATTAPSIYAQQGKCRNHAAFSTLKTIKHPL